MDIMVTIWQALNIFPELQGKGEGLTIKENVKNKYIKKLTEELWETSFMSICKNRKLVITYNQNQSKHFPWFRVLQRR